MKVRYRDFTLPIFSEQLVEVIILLYSLPEREGVPHLLRKYYTPMALYILTESHISSFG